MWARSHPVDGESPDPPTRPSEPGRAMAMFYVPALLFTGECLLNAVECGRTAVRVAFVSVLRPCVHTDNIPETQSTPPAAVRRWGGHSATRRRRGGSNRGSGLAACDQRSRLPSALRGDAARGDHRTHAGGTISTDGQDSHGGHARDSRPSGGQPGQVTIGSARHGRASGPRPHSHNGQTRNQASAGGMLLEFGARCCDHGSVS
jgi:hypothetical protein